MIKLNLYSARRILRSGLALAAASLAACFAPWAYAWDIGLYNANIAQVGSHEGSVAYLTIHEPVQSSCPSGTLYYDITTPLGRSMHAVLIAAKVSGQKVRLAYDLPTPTDGLCRLKLVALM
jgi:hypothetical protein